MEANPYFAWVGLQVLPDNIPVELRACDQWVLWEARQNGERVEKIPKKVYSSGNAASNDPGTWADFDAAIGTYYEGDFAGVGFVLRADGGFVGADFDHCRNPETGEIEQEILIEVRRLNTYAEVSPSGTGLRVIGKGVAPPGTIKGKRFEVYDRGRFLTITGHRLPDAPQEVRHIPPDVMLEVRNRLIPPVTATQIDDDGTPYQGPTDVSSIIASLLRGDNLHDSLVRLAAHYVATGMPPKSIGHTLRGFLSACAARETEPGRWAERWREIPRIVASAVEKFRREPDAEPGTVGGLWDTPFPIADHLDIEPPPIEWFVEDRIQAGRGILITGVGGSSKTRFLYHLAIGAVFGRLPWGWPINKQGRAVLILTEDTAKDVHRTVYYTCKGMGLSRDEMQRLASGLVIYPMAGQDVRLLAQFRDVGMDGLMKTPAFDELQDKIASFGDVQFIGLDPALSFTTGDEMSQSDQRMLGKLVDDIAVRTGAAAAMVTHAAKGTLQTEEIGSHTSRGAGAITDAVRGEFALRTMTTAEAAKANITDQEEKKRLVQVVCTKGNHVPPAAFVPEWLRRGEHGVLEKADIDFDAGEEMAITERDLKALAILRQLSAGRTAYLQEWRAQCEEQGVVTGRTEMARNKAMQRIKSNLLAGGLITRGMGRDVYAPV